MSRDTLVLIAFCGFILLLLMRMRQRFSDNRKALENDESQPSGDTYTGMPVDERQHRQKGERRIRLITIVQLVVLAGLAFYMVPALVHDFTRDEKMDMMTIILRCLIFVFTIYVFVLGYIKVFRRKNKGNTKK